jgi:hypothetical protein
MYILKKMFAFFEKQIEHSKDKKAHKIRGVK